MENAAGLDIGTGFARWAELTDAYAIQLTAMHVGEPGARAEVARLAREIRQLTEPMGVTIAPPPPIPLHGSALR